MRRFRLLLAFLVSAAGLRAADGFADARRAQALLGSAVWSRVVRVDNAGVSPRYPRTVYALVFEMAGILWFYTDTEGTRSFSQYYGQLEREKGDFGPLLRALDPGFVSWTFPTGGSPEPRPDTGQLPNGCFIESVVLLRERLSLGDRLAHPRLLSYYVRQPQGFYGHTVLSYETDDGYWIVDPESPRWEQPIARNRARDAATLATAIRPDSAKARWIPLDDFAARQRLQWAAAKKGASLQGQG